MSDFRHQVREHFDAQSLLPEKVQAILAEGRAAAGGKVVPMQARATWLRRSLALAAVLVVALFGTWWMSARAGRVSYALMAPRIIEFFAAKPHLPSAPQDKEQLHHHLVNMGAPADFKIPEKLLPLESAACEIVDVKGERTFLSCYWREVKPARDERDLIHLLVGRAKDFYDRPSSTTPVVQEKDGWSFASWSEGDAVYLLATAAPVAKITPFLSCADVAPMDERQTAMAMAFLQAIREK